MEDNTILVPTITFSLYGAIRTLHIDFKQSCSGIYQQPGPYKGLKTYVKISIKTPLFELYMEEMFIGHNESENELQWKQ